MDTDLDFSESAFSYGPSNNVVTYLLEFLLLFLRTGRHSTDLLLLIINTLYIILINCHCK